MRQILAGVEGWPGGRKLTALDKFPFLQFLFQISAQAVPGWAPKLGEKTLSPTGIQNLNKHSWKAKDKKEQKRENHRGEALNSMYKLHPNLWLIPELDVWGADSKSHTKAERSILRFHMIPHHKGESLQFEFNQVIDFKKKKKIVQRTVTEYTAYNQS